MLRKAIISSIFEKKENPERCFLQKYPKTIKIVSKSINNAGFLNTNVPRFMEGHTSRLVAFGFSFAIVLEKSIYNEVIQSKLNRHFSQLVSMSLWAQ